MNKSIFNKSHLQLSEEIFDSVIEYAAQKNPKRHYTAIIGDIEKILNEIGETKTVITICDECGKTVGTKF